MSFKIELSGLPLEISIAEIDGLRLHEEVIDGLLEELAESISEDDIIKDPTIVDKETSVVLDGLHRTQATKKIGFNKIPVCYIDYQNPRVKLGSWFRIFQDLDMDYILEVCEDFDFEIDLCDLDNLDRLLSERESELILASEEDCYSLSKGSDSIKSIYDNVGKIERLLRSEGVDVRYETENSALENLNPDEIVLMYPNAEKREVVEVALSDSVFYHKMTRHVIPIRPMRVNVPLEMLSKDKSHVDEELEKDLENREIEHFPADTYFEGREYEEELLVFK